MTMSPGTLVTPLSLLLSVRAGVASTGVLSVALALVSALAIVALLVIWVTPAGSGVSTVMAKIVVCVLPTIRLPAFRVQLAPTQLQPAELAAALKLVLAGKVSVSTRLARLTLPVLA